MGGIKFTKQENWIMDNINKINVNFAVGVELYLTLDREYKRAPKLLQRIGLEWLYRVIFELE